jgi:hypothetical protein
MTLRRPIFYEYELTLHLGFHPLPQGTIRFTFRHSVWSLTPINMQLRVQGQEL